MDWGESDHAEAFIGAHQTFNNYPHLLDYVHRKLATPKSSPTLTGPTAPVMTGNIPTVAQLTQDTEETTEETETGFASNNQVGSCGHHCKQVHQKVRTCTCKIANAVLQCSFHALQTIAKPSTSYCGKFKNHSLVNAIRDEKTKEVIACAEACEHALLIWHSKTEQMRAIMFGLIDLHWRIDLDTWGLPNRQSKRGL